MNSRQKIGGFTLVEVLLATLIIIVATVPLMDAFLQGTRWTAESREMITAVNLAQMVLEKLDDIEYDKLDASEVTEPIPFGEYPQYKYQLLVEGYGIEGIKRIKVTVYDADTMKELATLVTDRSDWR
ncbi:type II secretion system GspH family protein [Thermovorax subterraneus]|nr:type II secretion system GspH family protein [Thermovorax subterraneus]